MCSMLQGAIILCGGRSSRMGVPKWSLPFGPEQMLHRVMRLVSEVCRPIVVVAARDQDLCELSSDVIVARDRQPERGPLEGLLAGLSALPVDVEAVYVTGCDVPLLVPALVRRMFELLGDHAVVVPVSGGYEHPLAAVYRPSVRPAVEQLLAADRLRPRDLFDLVPTRRVSEVELRDVDPRLDSLRNLNEPADYLAALADAGFEPPSGMQSL